MAPVQEMNEIASASYRLTTDGTIAEAAPWQASLYARLSAQESDAGYLLLTPPGAGKTEAIVIPSLGLRRGGAPRRLFLIGPNHATLDDPLYRLTPYLRSMAAADGVPRTLYLDAEQEGGEPVIHRFFADGAEDSTLAINPLAADVDLILTTFARFRELFFGFGGVHALPSAFAPEDGSPIRRDLFFFDEAHDYAPDGFSRFHRLVEFLFAEDTDIVVASSTMPAHYQEELSFLESVLVPASGGSACTLTHEFAAEPLQALEAHIRRTDFQNSRVFGVVESPADAEALYERLALLSPQRVYLYHQDQPEDIRRQIYARMHELQNSGEGCLLLTTGSAIESSDLDAATLLTTFCPPENLIRRAGRCNRRGGATEAQMIVLGDSLAPDARPLPPSRAAEYTAALQTRSGAPFDPQIWKSFI